MPCEANGHSVCPRLNEDGRWEVNRVVTVTCVCRILTFWLPVFLFGYGRVNGDLTQVVGVNRTIGSQGIHVVDRFLSLYVKRYTSRGHVGVL